jgi:hypothetical protein
MKKIIRRHSVVLILGIGILSLLAVYPLFQKGFFLSDDGEWMVIRFSAFYQTLGNGQLPPRFFGRLNHGFGYPIGVFLYPAFMYFATPLKLVGLGYADAIKTVIISSFLFSGVGTYLWLRLRFSVLAAIMGALLYVYFPYHLYDLYVRGSVGELVGFAVLPFLLISIAKKNVAWGSLLYGLLILSHNTFAFLLTPFLIIYTYFHQRSLLWMYLFGLLASAFFWFPSLSELPYTRFSEVAISRWQDYFLSEENFSLVGITGFLLLTVSAYGIFKGDKTVRLFAVIGVISLFFASSYSAIMWSNGILPKLVQFPWRFLILAVCAGSFLIAYSIDSLKGQKKIFLAALMTIIIAISALPILQEYKSVVRDEGFYATNEDTTTTHGEYMPRWVKKVPLEHPNQRGFWKTGNGEITVASQNSNRTQLSLKSSEGGEFTLNKIYYPGWQAALNGEPIPVLTSDEGYVMVHIPPGEHTIDFTFRETFFRFLSNIVSVLSIAVLVLFIIPVTNRRLQPLLEWYNKLLWKRK